MSTGRTVFRSATAVTVVAAGLGVALIGTAGTAAADSGKTVHSPAREVVQFAPYAISVTFGAPLRTSGASMKIRTKDGEVGTGKVSTDANALRRALVLGAPNGLYTVDWTAVTKKGEKVSGNFSFTAGHPNDDPLNPEPPPTSGPGSRPAVTATPSISAPATPSTPSPAVTSATPTESPSATPSASSTPSASTSSSASSTPSASTTPSASSTPGAAETTASVRDPWAGGSDSQATAAAVPVDGGNRGDRGDGSSGSGSPYLLPLLSLGLGALLVIAAGLVSRRRRPSYQRLTIQTRSGVYSV